MNFEELDYQQTPLGAVSLRRRAESRAPDGIVYEVQLNDEFLMSSLFTAGEVALAELALSRLDVANASIVVGGLGLGYTAAAALDHRQTSEVVVIEALGPVIEWHRNQLVPLGKKLTDDPRCRFVCGDFFGLALAKDGFDHAKPGKQFDAILLDIDHAPDHHLAKSNAAFYESANLLLLKSHLSKQGIFAIWSNDPPAPEFINLLGGVFKNAESEIVRFPNPYSNDMASNTIYMAFD
ncbi:MAG: spermidine synthase [Pseudomonadota bacterium]